MASIMPKEPLKNYQIQKTSRFKPSLKINIMEKSNSQKIKVGIFVVVGTIILIAALYFIGSKQQMFTRNIKIYGTFNNVNGLTLGNNVRYSGINIGTVSKIEMFEEGEITVEMTVEEKVSKFIKKDALASIGTDGLVG